MSYWFVTWVSLVVSGGSLPIADAVLALQQRASSHRIIAGAPVPSRGIRCSFMLMTQAFIVAPRHCCVVPTRRGRRRAIR